MKQILCLIFLCMLSGCESKTTSSKPRDSTSTTPAAQVSQLPDEQKNKLILQIVSDSNVEMITEGITPELIKEKVESLDWNNPKLASNVSVQRGSQIHSFWIEGSLKPVQEEEALFAGWNGKNPQTGIGSTNATVPLKSIDEGVALLVSYFKDDDQWKTMVEWKFPWQEKP